MVGEIPKPLPPEIQELAERFSINNEVLTDEEMARLKPYYDPASLCVMALDGQEPKTKAVVAEGFPEPIEV